MLNYLTNALQYFPKDALVQVALWVEGGSTGVMVSDHGPGVPEVERERVWEPFHQVPETKVINQGSEGLGLGLHICKTIIEHHHGQVIVESAAGTMALISALSHFSYPFRVMVSAHV